VEDGYWNQLDSEIGNVREDAVTFSHRMLYPTIAGRQPFSTTLFSKGNFLPVVYRLSTTEEARILCGGQRRLALQSCIAIM
jgi:hypothetical protein